MNFTEGMVFGENSIWIFRKSKRFVEWKQKRLLFCCSGKNPGRRTSYGGLLNVLYSAARKHAPQHTI